MEPQAISEGQHVWVTTLHRPGTVSRIRRKLFSSDIHTITVKLDEPINNIEFVSVSAAELEAMS